MIRTHLRRVARRGALEGLCAVRAISGNTHAAYDQPRVHLPYLHDIPTGEERQLRRFLADLEVDHTFISYSEAIDRIHHGPIDKPYVAFSFDDGFLSNLRAAEILEEFGATACFFVPTGFIDSELSPPEAMKAFGFSEGTCEPAMTWDDLCALKERGHEIGNHTMSHRTLSLLSADEAAEDIGAAAERIRQVTGDCRHFAWPRGTFSHFTADAARTVFATGHVSCASAVRGAHTETLHGGVRESLCVRRDHIMTSWPLRHCQYFISRGSRSAGLASNLWPSDWEVIDES